MNTALGVEMMKAKNCVGNNSTKLIFVQDSVNSLVDITKTTSSTVFHDNLHERMRRKEQSKAWNRTQSSPSKL
jgi:hypothetical protein